MNSTSYNLLTNKKSLNKKLTVEIKLSINGMHVVGKGFLTFPQPPPQLIFLLPCFTFDLLFYLMILWIYKHWALIPAVCFMQKGINFTEVWHNVFFGSALIWSHTRAHKPTSHTGAKRLTHPYKYILTLPVMCWQQLSVLHWINNLLTSKLYVAEFHNLYAFQKLEVAYLLIRFNKITFFLWNIKNTDRNGVNKQLKIENRI